MINGSSIPPEAGWSSSSADKNLAGKMTFPCRSIAFFLRALLPSGYQIIYFGASCDSCKASSLAFLVMEKIFFSSRSFAFAASRPVEKA